MKLVLDLQGAQSESRMRGIGRQAMSLATALVARAGAHDVHILLNRRLDANLQDLLAVLEPIVPPGNIRLFGVPGATAERERGNLWRTHAAELTREAVLASMQPDIVHIASLFEGYVDDAVTSIGRFETPHAIAVTLHDLIPLVDPARYLSEPGPRAHWLRRAQFLKRADLLLSVSEHSRREAVERLHIDPARIAVMSAGVDAAFRPVALSAGEETALRERYALDKPFLFYVGAVDPRKNVESIVAAFAGLPAALRETRLLAFAGRLFDEEIGRLRIAAARHGIPAASLRFCQHVPEGDLVRLYAICEAFVFPSTHEGFGLPVLEAMACGAPVLSSDRTSLPEVVANPDLLFDPSDLPGFTDRLHRLLTEPGFRDMARRWGLERAAALTWPAAAARALDALEALDAERRARRGTMIAAPVPIARKPTMAFFSPLPGDRSGIADYSAELLPELARFYEIECIIGPDTSVTDPWVLANYPVRDIGWFERNATSYDRVVYSIGNSHYHAHMLDLMQRYPGTIILHDFFLSDLLNWMCNASGALPYDEFFRELYRTHGLSGLLREVRDGRTAVVDTLPVNHVVFRSGNGIIAHSRFVVEQARTLYGDTAADTITVVPHLRAAAVDVDRDAARARLGIGPDDYLVCSFGVMTERKCSRALFDAWAASRTGRARTAKLVFVGENAAGPYGDALARAIADQTQVRVEILGYAPPAIYRDYLHAADLAVQLRTQSRGETSGTILDCLAAGLPVIANAHGSTAELPDDALLLLPDVFTVDALADAIDRFSADPAVGQAASAGGLAHIRSAHAPLAIGTAMHAAIESFATRGPVGCENVLIGALADFNAPVPPDRDDWVRVSAVLADQRPHVGLPQILFDVTVLAEHDARTGIQRVVRAMLVNLIQNPPPGYRVEAVRMDGHRFRYARDFVARSVDIPAAVLPDDPVEYDAGDIYLSIDWVPDRLPLVETWLSDFGLAGGRVVIGVHDLLPLQLPQYFPPFMPEVTRRWLETALRVAHGFTCVSRTVADDVVRFGTALGVARRPIDVDWFHNAADLVSSMPSRGRPKGAGAILAAIDARPAFLMVGTVEPRKGHAQVLKGFEQLWRDGVDVALVIVGKAGWMMDAFCDGIARHPEHDKRLFWLQGISDEFLDEVYRRSAALVAASAGEGFGLPLIEGAFHGLSLIARDIPVFREVAGDHAFYFDGETPDAVARGVQQWLQLRSRGQAPRPQGMPVQTWAQSTTQMIRGVLGDDHYARIDIAPPARGTATQGPAT